MNNFGRVIFNSEDISKVVLNGETVWNKGISPIGYPYTIGVLSDIHIDVSTSEETHSQSDLNRALSYYENLDAKMIVASGDLTVMGTNAEFAAYKQIRDAATIPVFETTGNHEASSGRTYKSVVTDENCIAYHFNDLVGHDFCYYLKGNKYYARRFSLSDGALIYQDITQDSNVDIPNGDVYIFVGILGDRNNGIFFTEELQWLKDVLESNRNNRCFVIEHCRAERLVYDSSSGKYTADNYAHHVSGNYNSTYLKPLWGDATNKYDSKNAVIFESLMAHYTNCVWLHGHTHQSAHLAKDTGDMVASIDKYFGDKYNAWSLDAGDSNTKYSYSIHISSCAEPRETNGANPNGSEGCVFVVDVNSITVKYIDFVTNEKVLEYTIQTPRRTIQAGTYSDSTGTIS